MGGWSGIFRCRQVGVRGCDVCGMVPRRPGLYILLFNLADAVELRRANGEVIAALPPASYVYIGSAWGPGGLRARICRHLGCRPRRSLHWHIDRILASGGRVDGFTVAVGASRELEPLTAACLAATRLAEPPLSRVAIGGTDDPTGFPHVLRCRPGAPGYKCLQILWDIQPYTVFTCVRQGENEWDCYGTQVAHSK